MNTPRSKTNETGKTVIISSKAYYKMLVHVLRFGSKERDPRDFKEVMGVLIGRLEGEPDQKGIRDVVIEDAVPISHGGTVEVAFAQQDYVTFSEIDAKYAEQNLFSCGWYHSHPGLRIFFSNTDVKNQLGWQTPNPSAIGIVFDHTYLEKAGDLGFRTFRLDDPTKGTRSDYHEVETIVKPPDSIDYYFKIINLINKIHSKEQPILEINETPDPFGEVSFPSDVQLAGKEPTLNTDEILLKFQKNFFNFVEYLFKPIFDFLNSFSQKFVVSMGENNLIMKNSLVNIKENISSGIKRIQNTFRSELIHNLDQLETYVDDRLEVINKEYLKTIDLIGKLKDNLLEKVNNSLVELKADSGSDLINNINKATNEIATLAESEQNTNDELEKFKTKLAKFIDSINNKNSDAKDLIAKKIKELNSEILGAFHSSRKRINTLEEEEQKFASNLKGLQVKLDEITQSVKDKIQRLEDENKNYTKEMKDLKDQKEKLEGKINELETQNGRLEERIKELEKRS
ncbi:MAG: hypothetical protein GF353_21120 [Candidatus Lokiarchaeota archaeon]|nr:hypothetical protein [Candidatus Lokiarchaeota archaeon]